MEAIITLYKVRGQRWQVQIKLPVAFLRAYDAVFKGSVCGDYLNPTWGRSCVENSIVTDWRVHESTWSERDAALGFIEVQARSIKVAAKEMNEIFHQEWAIPLDSDPADANSSEVSEEECERMTCQLEGEGE